MRLAPRPAAPRGWRAARARRAASGRSSSRDLHGAGRTGRSKSIRGTTHHAAFPSPGPEMTRSALRHLTVLGSLAAGLPAASLSAQAILPPPIELRVPKPPTVATADAGSFLVYELHVTNFGGQPLTLKRVEVVTADAAKRTLLTLGDSALGRNLARPGATIAAELPKLPGGARAVVYLWVPLAPGDAPAALLD